MSNSTANSVGRLKQAATLKITQDYGSREDGMAVTTRSDFAAAICRLITNVRPRKIIETGTYLGTGTTTVIAKAVRRLGVDAAFYTIEVNPAYYARARTYFAANNLNVIALNGLSIPRAILPAMEEIIKSTVTDVEYEGIFVDHRAEVRAQWYYQETNVQDVPDNLLYLCLKRFDFEPDFVLLDSAGHIGNIEFNYLVENLRGCCYIALDDIYHIKHHKSFRQIASDRRFELVVASREKFGFCIARFVPD